MSATWNQAMQNSSNSRMPSSPLSRSQSRFKAASLATSDWSLPSDRPAIRGRTAADNEGELESA